MEEVKFNCSSCGACCRRVGTVIHRFKEMGFPYDVKENGECEMLEGNKCKVYENRPEVCSVEKMFEKNWQPLGIEKKVIYLREAKICNEWIKEDAMDKKYLINLDIYK